MDALASTGARWRRASYPVRFLVLMAVSTALAVTAGPVEEVFRAATEGAVVRTAPWSGLDVFPQTEGVLYFTAPSGSFSYQVVRECAGLQVLLLFAAAVMAYRIDFRKRVVGVVVGTVVLVVANVVRLVLLADLGVWRPDWFAAVHDVGWPLFQISGIILGTLLWLRWASRPVRRTANHQAWWSAHRRPLIVMAACTTGLGFTYALGLHDWYGRYVLMPFPEAVVKVLWAGRASLLSSDPVVFSVTRLGVLLWATGIVALVQPPGRGGWRVARAAGAVIAIHVCGSLVQALLAVSSAMPGRLGRVPGGWDAVITGAEVGLAALLVLRESNRRRPSLA